MFIHKALSYYSPNLGQNSGSFYLLMLGTSNTTTRVLSTSNTVELPTPPTFYNASYSSYQHIPAAHGSEGQQYLLEQLSQAANGGVGSHHYVPGVGVYKCE